MDNYGKSWITCGGSCNQYKPTIFIITSTEFKAMGSNDPNLTLPLCFCMQKPDQKHPMQLNSERNSPSLMFLESIQ